MRRIGNRAALELSIGTVVILVLGVTMLIMGMVVTRSIMCGALSLTGEVNSKVKSQLNTLFDSTEGEVVCIGAGGEAVKFVPGKENIVHCAVKASEKADYEIKVTDYSSSVQGLSKDTLQKWITTSSWKGTVAPGDTTPKKAARLKLPDNAPEGTIRIQLQIMRDGELISTQDLDFEVSRLGFIRSAAC